MSTESRRQCKEMISYCRRDVSVNDVLVGAVKVASKAVDKARDVAERAVGKAQQWYIYLFR